MSLATVKRKENGKVRVYKGDCVQLLPPVLSEF